MKFFPTNVSFPSGRMHSHLLLKGNGGLSVSLLLALLGGSQLCAQSSGQINCNDPLLSSSSLCRPNAAGINQSTDPLLMQVPGQTAANPDATPRRENSQQIYTDSAGLDRQNRSDPNSRRNPYFLPDPVTDFQRLAQSSTGESLPVFGRDLFQQAPSTFAPADQIPVLSDYVVGPGDEVLVRLWGAETFNSQLTVDTTGSIYIPKVGAVHVAGLRADELQKQISTEVNHTYRNYRISVSLGRLRSIQVLVVGEARQPGTYTISALSTVLNALFISGGPNVQGSLRRIQIRHEGQPATEFDLYDLVLRGDKAHDIRLQTGDTIFIPAAGPQVALAGSVRHPAIYELRDQTTLQDLLQLAGGFTSTAEMGAVSVERIDGDHLRHAFKVSPTESKVLPLRDGDVLYVNHISQGYEKSVTIRGNLSNPGRFAWHPGMRLNEIIPDRMSLLTRDYWRERNRLGVPVPLFEPLGNSTSRPLNNSPYGTGNFPQDSYANPYANSNVNPYAGNSQPPYQSPYLQDDSTVQQNQLSRANTGAALALQSNLPPTGDSSQAGGLFGGSAFPDASTASNPAQRNGSLVVNSADPGVRSTGNNQAPNNPLDYRVPHRIGIPAPEIDWSYAVIERLDPDTLKSVLLPFNLGKLIEGHTPDQNLELQPGDVVTILSQADIPVPVDEQTKFIRLEGEFASAGVYSVRPGEDLEDVIRRAGGLTPKAYLYGSSFLRESARVFQQERLNEYISTLSADMERSAAVRAASSSTGILDPNALGEQRTLIAQLRQLRASGRVVLEFRPNSAGIETVPRIPLENGDVFRVPSRPNTVSVIGAVYGQNVFLYDSKRHVEDYVSLAGKPNRIADRKHAFVIRADGSIFSRERAKGILSNDFDSMAINPGDSIVIPEKLIKPTALRNILDYSQVLSSFGLAAAAINVVR